MFSNNLDNISGCAILRLHVGNFRDREDREEVMSDLIQMHGITIYDCRL